MAMAKAETGKYEKRSLLEKGMAKTTTNNNILLSKVLINIIAICVLINIIAICENPNYNYIICQVPLHYNYMLFLYCNTLQHIFTIVV